MATIILHRRYTAATWTANNPILYAGELGYESDTNKFKWGDGTTAWNSLSYFGIGSGIAGVSSFNSRTGAVTPATNDYTWAQIDKTTSSLADVTNHSHTVLTDIGTNTHAQIDTFIASKGANSGLATLDSGGKIPVTQLPSSVMQYLGTWDASTNTPTLTDGGAFVNGDVYLCSVAGSTNFGHGAISFAVGDWAVYNGTIWQKSLNSNAVVSVNGYTGVVSLTKSDVGLGNVTNDAQLKIASNLSDLNNITTAVANLGLTIGTNVQAYSANLTTYAGIAPSANVQTLLGAADYSAFKTDLSLNNVENTALSTWAGTANITTLGTITTGTWNGTAIADTYISSASTWNAKQAALTFSTGLTNTANTITNNLSVGVSGGQTAIGGTGITDVLSLKGTTGNGTLTSPAIQALVGNNGGTTALTILNNGNVGIGTASPASYNLAVNARARINGNGGTPLTISNGGISAGDIAKFDYNDTTGNLQISTSGGSQQHILLIPGGTGNVGIGTTSPNSSLHNNGSFALPIVSKTANYTLTSSDYTVIASGAGTTITLPTAVNIQGRIYVIKRNDSTNNITVNTTSSQTIDGATSLTLSTNYQVIMVQSDNANWQIISAQ